MMESVKISPVEGGYKLLQDLTYKDTKIPKSFITNGIDFKTRILSLFINKYDPKVIKAVIVHDYLCEFEDYTKADRYFEELLPDIWQKPFMVFAVKIYHKLRYRI